MVDLIERDYYTHLAGKSPGDRGSRVISGEIVDLAEIPGPSGMSLMK